MQKLITVYLRDNVGNSPTSHGSVQEHLDDYLKEGWEVKNMVPVGSVACGGDTSTTKVAGWLSILLEK